MNSNLNNLVIQIQHKVLFTGVIMLTATISSGFVEAEVSLIV